MKKNPDVERWFTETKPPAEAAIRRVREIILSADPRLAEAVKHRTLNFAFEGDLAAFVQHDKKTVTLMFNRGARIPGRFPNLEGTGPTARFMRFADLAEVEARAAELSRIAAAWCALMAPGSSEVAPESKSRTGRAPSQLPKKAKPRTPPRKGS